MTRILHVTASMDPVAGGGTAARTAALARSLADRGAESSVLCLDLDPGVHRQLAPVRVHALPCLSRRFYLPGWAPGRVHRAVRDADVVHLVGHWTLLNVLAYRAARRHRRPYVVCPAGALRVQGRSRVLKRFYNAVVGRRLVRNAAAHVAVTQDERADFAAYGVDPSGVDVVPNGVDAREFDTEAAAPGEAAWRARVGDRPYVLFVGRLNPIKGPDLLVRGAAGVGGPASEYRLVLAGPDEGMAGPLRRLAGELGVAARTVLPGPVSGAEKAAAYRGASLLVVPSRSEAMSLVALEAGASGTPVLLTDACGFPEVARVEGGLVVPASAEGIEQGLRRLLDRPEDLPGMGRRLRRLVLDSYTWEHAAARYLDICGRCMPRRPAGFVSPHTPRRAE